MGKSKRKEDVCAIFVHAGAGFHSRENEKKHLEVCELAVQSGMTFLRHGGTAIDAVEVALMVLEDAPITNAGYGSNLTEKGIVECDASIIDHFGRSGACGAVANVKNPIQLARKIYDRAHKSPGMSRVPPNFLCGEGATDFAWDNRVVVVPDESLVAPIARHRWNLWCRELDQYYREHPEAAGEADPYLRRPLTPIETRFARAFPDIPKDFAAQIASARDIDDESPVPGEEKDRKALDGQLPKAKSPTKRSSLSTPRHADPPGAAELDQRAQNAGSQTAQAPRNDQDAITDTVGAIAIDRYGNIAAGSSSGGIGMKHRGRVGPAALIGIGTHVLPVDPSDPDKTTVAVVTSGTGEHIASTFAASTCATRIYYNQRMGPGGMFDEVSEEEAISSMLTKEFTGHPAVANSEINGSIGIMAVKKTEDGIGLFFAHNTESFALASMSNRDTKPNCVMSRNQNRAPVAQGGLMIRPKYSSPISQEKKKPKT
ncbi:uncharacterized protein N7459_003060 [Penicillium hispanicum]|uniref:uncharacterized protein n=1 Tax=Penicillium hispanicum TaxID=1080232 RepID=UPI002541AA08|nr:uncharacterized protein N7459_003060 [Penicillium hispanicum]KAJ5587295.1 hypothetical protein N7459_003060 [Penicillium hispanicum]